MTKNKASGLIGKYWTRLKTLPMELIEPISERNASDLKLKTLEFDRNYRNALAYFATVICVHNTILNLPKYDQGRIVFQ